MHTFFRAKHTLFQASCHMILRPLHIHQPGEGGGALPACGHLRARREVLHQAGARLDGEHVRADLGGRGCSNRPRNILNSTHTLITLHATDTP